MPAIKVLLNPNEADGLLSRQIQKAYSTFEQLEFAESPEQRAHLRAAGISDEARIRNTSLDADFQLKLSLAKRAISFCHGAYIILSHYHKNADGSVNEEKVNLFLKEIFVAAEKFINEVLNEKYLTTPGKLQTYTEEKLNHFLCEIGGSIATGTNRTGLDKKVASKTAKEIEKELIAAERLANWERRASYPIATVTKNKIQVDTPIVHLTDALKTELDSIHGEKKPLWFQRLSKLEQEWWFNHVEQIKSGELISPPATIRNCPMLANFSKNQIFLLKDGLVQSSSTHIRRSTLTPLGVHEGKMKKRIHWGFIGAPEVDFERNRLARLNAEQLLEVSNPVTVFEAFWSDPAFRKQLDNARIYAFQFDQNLVTPLALLNRFEKEEDNNRRFRDESIAALDEIGQAKNQDVLPTNWPINLERGAPFYNPFEYAANIAAKNKLETIYAQISRLIFTKNNLLPENFPFVFDDQNLISIDNAKLALFAKEVKNNLAVWAPLIFPSGNQPGQYDAEKAQRFCLGLAALSDFRYLWADLTGKDASSNYKKYQHNNIELFAAAQMQMMAQGCGGSASGGCKSAKDREGTMLNHVNAMIEHYHQYGELPDYKGKDFEQRKNFVALCAGNFQSGHQQSIAAENAFGANGCLDGASKHSTKKWVFGVASFKQLFNLQPMVAGDVAAKAGKELLSMQNTLGKTNKPKPDFKHHLDLTAAKPALVAAKIDVEKEKRLKNHKKNLPRLQNRELAALLMASARSGNYLTEEAGKSFNEQMWAIILNPPEIKEHKHDDFVAVEIKALQNLLQLHNILLTPNQIKAVQKENARLRELYQQIADKKLQEQISKELPPFAYKQEIDELWIEIANELTEQKALPADFHTANQKIKAEIVSRKLQGIIKLNKLGVEARENKLEFNKTIDVINQYADYFLNPEYQLDAKLLVAYFTNINKKLAKDFQKMSNMAQRGSIPGLHIDSSRLLLAFAQAANLAYANQINSPVLAQFLLDLNTEYYLLPNVNKADLDAFNEIMLKKNLLLNDVQEALKKIVKPVDISLAQQIQQGYADLNDLLAGKLIASSAEKVHQASNPLGKELLPTIQFYSRSASKLIWEALSSQIKQPLVGQQLSDAYAIVALIRKIEDYKLAIIKELDAQTPDPKIIRELTENLAEQTEYLIAKVKEVIPNSNYLQELLLDQKESLNSITRQPVLPFPDNLAHAFFTLDNSISKCTKYFAQAKIRYKHDPVRLDKITKEEATIKANFMALAEGRENLLPIARSHNDYARIPQFLRTQQQFTPKEFCTRLTDREQLLAELQKEEKTNVFDEELAAIAMLKTQLEANIEPQALIEIALNNLAKHFAQLQNTSFIFTDADKATLTPQIENIHQRLAFILTTLEHCKGFPVLALVETQMAELSKIVTISEIEHDQLKQKLKAINVVIQQVKTNRAQLHKLQNLYPQESVPYQAQITAWQVKVDQAIDYKHPAPANTWQEVVQKGADWFAETEIYERQKTLLAVKTRMTRNELTQRGLASLNVDQEQKVNPVFQAQALENYVKASQQAVLEAEKNFTSQLTQFEEKIEQQNPEALEVDPEMAKLQAELASLEKQFKKKHASPKGLLETFNHLNRMMVTPVIDNLTRAQALNFISSELSQIKKTQNALTKQIAHASNEQKPELDKKLKAIRSEIVKLQSFEHQITADLGALENLRYKVQTEYLLQTVTHPVIRHAIATRPMSLLQAAEIPELTRAIEQMVQKDTPTEVIDERLKKAGIILTGEDLKQTVLINQAAIAALASAKDSAELVDKLQKIDVRNEKFIAHIEQIYQQHRASEDEVYQRLLFRVDQLENTAIPNVAELAALSTEADLATNLQNAPVIKSTELALLKLELEAKDALTRVRVVKESYPNKSTASYQKISQQEEIVLQRLTKLTAAQNLLKLKMLPDVSIDKYVANNIGELKAHSAQCEKEFQALFDAFDKHYNGINVLPEKDLHKKIEKLIVLRDAQQKLDQKLVNLRQSYQQGQTKILALQRYYQQLGQTHPDLKGLMEGFDLNQLQRLDKVQTLFLDKEKVKDLSGNIIEMQLKKVCQNISEEMQHQMPPLIEQQIKLAEQLSKKNAELSADYYTGKKFITDWKVNQTALKSAIGRLNNFSELFNKSGDLLEKLGFAQLVQKTSELQNALENQVVEMPAELKKVEREVDKCFSAEQQYIKESKQAVAQFKNELAKHDREVKEELSAYYERSRERFAQISAELEQIQQKITDKQANFKTLTDFNSPIFKACQACDVVLADAYNVKVELQKHLLLIEGQKARSASAERDEFDVLATAMEKLHQPVEQASEALKINMATIYAEQDNNDLTTHSVNLLLSALKIDDKEQRAIALNQFNLRSDALGRVFAEANSTLEGFAKDWQTKRDTDKIPRIFAYTEPLFKDKVNLNNDNTAEFAQKIQPWRDYLSSQAQGNQELLVDNFAAPVLHYREPLAKLTTEYVTIHKLADLVKQYQAIQIEFMTILKKLEQVNQRTPERRQLLTEALTFYQTKLPMIAAITESQILKDLQKQATTSQAAQQIHIIFYDLQNKLETHRGVESAELVTHDDGDKLNALTTHLVTDNIQEKLHHLTQSVMRDVEALESSLSAEGLKQFITHSHDNKALDKHVKQLRDTHKQLIAQTPAIQALAASTSPDAMLAKQLSVVGHKNNIADDFVENYDKFINEVKPSLLGIRTSKQAESLTELQEIIPLIKNLGGYQENSEKLEQYFTAAMDTAVRTNYTLMKALYLVRLSHNPIQVADELIANYPHILDRAAGEMLRKLAQLTNSHNVLHNTLANHISSLPANHLYREVLSERLQNINETRLDQIRADQRVAEQLYLARIRVIGFSIPSSLLQQYLVSMPNLNLTQEHKDQLELCCNDINLTRSELIRVLATCNVAAVNGKNSIILTEPQFKQIKAEIQADKLRREPLKLVDMKKMLSQAETLATELFADLGRMDELFVKKSREDAKGIAYDSVIADLNNKFEKLDDLQLKLAFLENKLQQYDIVMSGKFSANEENELLGARFAEVNLSQLRARLKQPSTTSKKLNQTINKWFANLEKTFSNSLIDSLEELNREATQALLSKRPNKKVTTKLNRMLGRLKVFITLFPQVTHQQLAKRGFQLNAIKALYLRYDAVLNHHENFKDLFAQLEQLSNVKAIVSHEPLPGLAGAAHGAVVPNFSHVAPSHSILLHVNHPHPVEHKYAAELSQTVVEPELEKPYEDLGRDVSVSIAEGYDDFMEDNAAPERSVSRSVAVPEEKPFVAQSHNIAGIYEIDESNIRYAVHKDGGVSYSREQYQTAENKEFLRNFDNRDVYKKEKDAAHDIALLAYGGSTAKPGEQLIADLSGGKEYEKLLVKVYIWLKAIDKNIIVNINGKEFKPSFSASFFHDIKGQIKEKSEWINQGKDKLRGQLRPDVPLEDQRLDAGKIAKVAAELKSDPDQFQLRR